jgi:hypothetical protein
VGTHESGVSSSPDSAACKEDIPWFESVPLKFARLLTTDFWKKTMIDRTINDRFGRNHRDSFRHVVMRM